MKTLDEYIEDMPVKLCLTHNKSNKWYLSSMKKVLDMTAYTKFHAQIVIYDAIES